MTTPTKAGYKDKVVGTLKQVCGTVFDEPNLVNKGKNQRLYGSRVVVNEGPFHSHPQTSSAVVPTPLPLPVHTQLLPSHSSHPTEQTGHFHPPMTSHHDHQGAVHPSPLTTSTQRGQCLDTCPHQSSVLHENDCLRQVSEATVKPIQVIEPHQGVFANPVAVDVVDPIVGVPTAPDAERKPSKKWF